MPPSRIPELRHVCALMCSKVCYSEVLRTVWDSLRRPVRPVSERSVTKCTGPNGFGHFAKTSPAGLRTKCHKVYWSVRFKPVYLLLLHVS